jgi:hypothetical protein
LNSATRGFDPRCGEKLSDLISRFPQGFNP